MLLGDLITRNARRYPDKAAVVFGDRRFTYREFNNRVNCLANALVDLGIKKGDRVAVVANTCSEYLEIFYAGAKGGMVITPLNPRVSGQELSYFINNSEANTVILGGDFVEAINSIRTELSKVSYYVVIAGKAEGMKSYEELISTYPPDELSTELDEDDLAYIIYTSGTTGLPKGVMLSHKNILAGTANAVIEFRVEHDDVMLVATPLFLLGSFLVPAWHFYMGGTNVFLETFDPKAFLEAIEKEKATTSLISSFWLVSLLEQPDIDKRDLTSMRRLVYSGAPMPFEVLKRAIGVFGNIFSQGYGLTETGGFVTYLMNEDHVLEGPEERVRKTKSCGREALNMEVRVVDEDGRDVTPGEEGEIIARGDNIMKGYWRLPELTTETIKQGYLYTGDMATIDEEGYIYLLDRKKDVITSGGKSIPSREVEEVLYSLPFIFEATVIGVPDEQLGESVKAIVVLREGKKVGEEEILKFCEEKLEDYKRPKSVDFLDTLPRNPTGKVVKGKLREIYAKGS